MTDTQNQSPSERAAEKIVENLIGIHPSSKLMIGQLINEVFVEERAEYARKIEQQGELVELLDAKLKKAEPILAKYAELQDRHDRMAALIWLEFANPDNQMFDINANRFGLVDIDRASLYGWLTEAAERYEAGKKKGNKTK